MRCWASERGGVTGSVPALLSVKIKFVAEPLSRLHEALHLCRRDQRRIIRVSLRALDLCSTSQAPSSW